MALNPIVMKTHKLTQRFNTSSSTRGLSLIELMVAMAIGLVLTLVVLVSTLSIGRQLQGTGALAAADVNAQIALSLIDDAARSAGAGLYNRKFPICPTWNSFRNGAVAADGVPLLPVRIIAGGVNPDTIEFSGITGPNAGAATPLVRDSGNGNAGFTISNTAQFAVGDIALVGAPAANAASLGTAPPCTLFQVTGVAQNLTGAACDGNATECTLIQRAGNATWNPATPTTAYANAPPYGFRGAGVNGPAVVVRVGATFRQDAFTVLPACNVLVNYDAFQGLPTCTVNPLAFGGVVSNALASDVVALRAQYGIAAVGTYKDTPTPFLSNEVTQWVNANGAWAAPTPIDAVRIQAIRVVVVTRSREPEVGTEVTPATCTNPAGVVNTGPCSFDDAAAPVINVSTAPVVAGRTWRHYRYRVHQSVIPLRNVIWNSNS